MRPIAAIALVCLLCSGRAASGQLPATRLDSLFPAGARIGDTVEVTLTGVDLDGAAELLFSHPAVTAQAKMAEATPFDKAHPIPNVFLVTVADNGPEGPVDVRVRGKYGLSNPRVFELSRLAEINEVEPNNDFEQAVVVAQPQVVNGQINGTSDVDLFRVAAQAGQRILFDCRTRRIDSLLEPVLSIYDAKGRELMSSRDADAREAMLDFQTPATGDYFVKVTDAYFRGNASYVYRLAVGVLPHIDFVFPPAGAAGTNGPLTLFGRNLPGGKPAEFFVAGRRLEQLRVNVPLPSDPAKVQSAQGRVEPEQTFLDAVEYRTSNQLAVSNAVRIGIATAPVVLEAEENDTPQQAQVLQLPCEVAGRFYPARDDDWYAFKANQGDEYTIEVMSQRLGLPTDTQLVIHQVTTTEEGEERIKVIATADDIGSRDRAQFDTRTADASHQFVAPAEATYRLSVRDGYSSLRSDPRLIYRLAIRSPQPDFRLVAVPQDPWGALVLRRGDRTTVDVLAERRDGLSEPITVSVSGLPKGVTSEPVVLGPSMTVASLVLTSTADVAPTIAELKVAGTATIDGRDVTRVARAGTANTSMRMLQPNQRPQNSLPARVSRRLMLSVIDSQVPVSVELASDKVWETTRAGILKIPYTAARRDGYKGQVQCAVANLPANINPTTFTIAPNTTKGEFQLTLRNNTPAGLYSLHAGVYVTGYSYERNPAAAEEAKQRKEEIDKIVADADKANKEAAAAKQQADKKASDEANQLKAAEQANANAKQAEADADAALKKATAAAEQAKAAAMKKPEDGGLKANLAAAEKALATATTKKQAATDALQKAGKMLAAAQSRAADAMKLQEAAEQAAAEAAAFAKAAADRKKVSDKRATDTERAAKAKNINFWTASTPIKVRIHEYPITLAELPANTRVKQGENLELPIKITRLVGYQDQVSFSAIVRGVSGVSIRNVNIPKGQTEVKLPITLSTSATPGEHEITLRATMRVNNQTLTLDQPFPLQIEQAEPKK